MKVLSSSLKIFNVIECILCNKSSNKSSNWNTLTLNFIYTFNIRSLFVILSLKRFS